MKLLTRIIPFLHYLHAQRMPLVRLHLLLNNEVGAKTTEVAEVRSNPLAIDIEGLLDRLDEPLILGHRNRNSVDVLSRTKVGIVNCARSRVG